MEDHAMQSRGSWGVENNGSNLTLKTLYDIVEKGLGGKVKISIEI